MPNDSKKDSYLGILLAILAVIIWSGNFIISRGVSAQIGPVSLAFYRWLMATIIIAPFAWKTYREEKELVRVNWKYLCWVSLTGITIFNTCVYVAGHYTTAINLALIGTTSSPIFATILAVIFLKERLSGFRIAGMIICIAGIVLLISKGSWQTLAGFHFSTGDIWVLVGAFAFAMYNILVKRRTQTLSALNFLFVIFALGTIMLFPFFIGELFLGGTTQWSWSLFSVILYLGAGTSVIAFLCWNIALQKLGAGRTVLFGNLIPIFSTLEAVWLLGEEITNIHIISGLLVVLGLLLANARKSG
ncbi:MAG: family transporter [Sediminibacterium sp.]|nr:family transporter [Sediminibacterium sp.]